MKRSKIFLAFGVGCMTAIAANFAANVNSQRSTRGGTNPFESRLKALEQRTINLKQQVPQPSKKVVAPFVVTNPGGTRTFEVNPDGVNVYAAGRLMATMGGQKYGGILVATSATENSSIRLDTVNGGPSLSVIENNQNRIELGRGATNGTYRLKFLSSSGQNIAGIGESLQTQTGLALVFDKSGNLKARIAVTDDNKGLIDVLGINKLPIAQLTEGSHKGGKLVICQADGCDPPMVEAGDAGGYGIVRVGPHGFNPGVTMLGLPGNVIAGKPQ